VSDRSAFRRSYRAAVVLGTIAIGLAIHWSALRAPMTLDDWDHYAMQQGIYPVQLHPLDMYDFVPNTDAARRALQVRGRLPWFAAPNLHLAVMRPLSSALVYLDYAALDAHHHPWRMHLHSLLWWVGLLAGAAAVLFEVLPFPAAAIALLLYTVDDAHTLPLVWAASRSQIISIAFMLWALWANISAHRGQPRMRWVAIGLVVLGVLAGEHALAPLAYLVAFDFLTTTGRIRERAMRALPWLVVGAGFVICHALLGYGAAGSTFYITPVAEPARYLAACAVRLPKLLAELGFAVPVDWWSLWPAWEVVLSLYQAFAVRGYALTAFGLQLPLGVLTGVVATTVVIWLGSRRAENIVERRELRALLGGALLSLAPLTGAEAMSRLNMAPGFGFCAFYGWLISRLISTVASGHIGLWRRSSAVLATALLLYLCVVYSGARSYYEGQSFANAWQPRKAADIFGHDQTPGLSGRHVIVIHHPEVTLEYSLMYMLHFDQQPLPSSIEVLSPAIRNAHIVERVSLNVIDILYPDPLLDAPFTRSVYRNEDYPFHAHQVVHGPRFDVGVVSEAAGQPTHLRFVFPTSLDDAQYVFMVPRLHKPGLMPFALPRVGEKAYLPPLTRLP
jgi:hypothetical protein